MACRVMDSDAACSGHQAVRVVPESPPASSHVPSGYRKTVQESEDDSNTDESVGVVPESPPAASATSSDLSLDVVRVGVPFQYWIPSFSVVGVTLRQIRSGV